MSGLVRPQRVVDGEEKPVNLLVYGKPGVGKSVLGSTGPTPILFLDMDEGLLSVRKMKRALAQELGVDKSQIYVRSAKSKEDVRKLIIELYNEFKEDPKWWATVVLDNLTELQRILQQDILMRDGNRVAMKHQDWGILLNEMQVIVRLLKHLPCNTLFLAHEKDGMEGNNSVKMPSLSGSISEKLPGDFDIICRYTLVEKEVPDPATQQTKTQVIRALRCTPTPTVQAKNRGGCLADWENPHLGKLIQKIAQSEA